MICGPLVAAPDLEHEGADAIARVVALAGNLLALGQDRLGLADLEDHVALLDAVDHAAEDLPLLAGELRVDALPLGVTHLLEDHLLGGLRGDAPEILRRLSWSSSSSTSSSASADSGPWHRRG